MIRPRHIRVQGHLYRRAQQGYLLTLEENYWNEYAHDPESEDVLFFNEHFGSLGAIVQAVHNWINQYSVGAYDDVGWDSWSGDELSSENHYVDDDYSFATLTVLHADGTSLTAEEKQELLDGLHVRADTTRQAAVPVWDEWGMYTPAGDRRITKIAQRAAAKMEALLAKTPEPEPEDVDRILVDFIAAWVRLGKTKQFGEAGDTDVREGIGAFHDKLWEAAGQRKMDSYSAWDRNYDAGWTKAQGAKK